MPADADRCSQLVIRCCTEVSDVTPPSWFRCFRRNYVHKWTFLGIDNLLEGLGLLFTPSRVKWLHCISRQDGVHLAISLRQFWRNFTTSLKRTNYPSRLFLFHPIKRHQIWRNKRKTTFWGPLYKDSYGGKRSLCFQYVLVCALPVTAANETFAFLLRPQAKPSQCISQSL